MMMPVAFHYLSTLSEDAETRLIGKLKIFYFLYWCVLLRRSSNDFPFAFKPYYSNHQHHF